ncbi:MAG: HesA/MoeB/ThiF family protein [Cyclobacteriaceae bacterium]|nr:HesA/MoeB/ThiF family protein [Cyclobacteriaceae bacterium]
MMNRFERQVKLPGIGREGQQKLQQAKVLVIGAGGLGCPALLYLAAAGVGTLGIVDGDIVDASNLNRQILFGANDVGKPKTACAAAMLRKKYPDVHLISYSFYLRAENITEVLQDFDIVLDGSDNFETRYLVNDACMLMEKPFVMGAIYQFEGQIGLFNDRREECTSVQYRDLYPEPPPAGQIPDCNQSGVLGVLPGIIGTLQATEVIKYICDLDKPKSPTLLIYNMLKQQFYHLEITPNPENSIKLPANKEALKNTDYSVICGAGTEEISWEYALDIAKKSMGKTALVDVREYGELPELQNPNCIKLPLSNLESQVKELQNLQNLIIFCQSGIRSQKAYKRLREIYPYKTILSIKGGINAAASTKIFKDNA